MKKLAHSLAIVGMALSASAAFSNSINGVVESIDRDRGIVMMEDGSEYVIPQGVNLGQFEPGAEVTVKFDTNNGEASLKSMHKAEPRDE